MDKKVLQAVHLLDQNKAELEDRLFDLIVTVDNDKVASALGHLVFDLENASFAGSPYHIALIKNQVAEDDLTGQIIMAGAYCGILTAMISIQDRLDEIEKDYGPDKEEKGEVDDDE